MAGLDQTDPALPLAPLLNFPLTHTPPHASALQSQAVHSQAFFCIRYNTGMVLSSSEKYMAS